MRRNAESKSYISMDTSICIFTLIIFYIKIEIFFSGKLNLTDYRYHVLVSLRLSHSTTVPVFTSPLQLRNWKKVRSSTRRNRLNHTSNTFDLSQDFRNYLGTKLDSNLPQRNVFFLKKNSFLVKPCSLTLSLW